MTSLKPSRNVDTEKTEKLLGNLYHCVGVGKSQIPMLRLLGRFHWRTTLKGPMLHWAYLLVQIHHAGCRIIRKQQCVLPKDQHSSANGWKFSLAIRPKKLKRAQLSLNSLWNRLCAPRLLSRELWKTSLSLQTEEEAGTWHETWCRLQASKALVWK